MPSGENIRLDLTSGYTPPLGDAVLLNVGEGANIGAMDNPMATATGEHLAGHLIDGDVSIPLGIITDDFLVGEAYQAGLFMPVHMSMGLFSELGNFAMIDGVMSTCEGEFLHGELIDASLSHPIASSSGEYVELVNGKAQLVGPIATTSGVLERATYGLATGPNHTATGTLKSGWLMSGAVSMPSAIVEADVLPSFNGQALMRPPTVVGQLHTGISIIGDCVAPAATCLGTPDNYAAIVAPMATVSAAMVGDMMASGAVVMRSPFVDGRMGMVLLDDFKSFCMTFGNAQVTEYTNFSVLASAKIGEANVAVTSDGIYLLDGSDDNGDPIDCLVRFGKDGMGSDYQKRVTYAYVGGRGPMAIRMHTDHGHVSPESLVDHHGVEHGTSRIKLGKGTKSRYWQPEISNVNGGGLEIDALNLIGEQTSRRVS